MQCLIVNPAQICAPKTARSLSRIELAWRDLLFRSESQDFCAYDTRLIIRCCDDVRQDRVVVDNVVCFRVRGARRG